MIIPLEQRLTQKSIAAACSNWIKEKADIRSMVKPNFLHGKMYHVIQESGIEKAVVGSSNFTVNGLGLGGNNNIELNMIIDSDRDRQELKQWFDGIWNDTTGLVEDVKDDVLRYLAQLYAENEPEFIYFKTLYHMKIISTIKPKEDFLTKKLASLKVRDGILCTTSKKTALKALSIRY